MVTFRRFALSLVIGLGLFMLCSPAFGKTPLEGYDDNKLNNAAHQTPKYIFGRVAQKHSLASVKDHASAEALLKSMLPELKAAGLIVKEAKRDKILVKTEIGWEWVDVVRGAGAPNPGWWWGSEGKPTHDGPKEDGDGKHEGDGDGKHEGDGDGDGNGDMGKVIGVRNGSQSALSTVPADPSYQNASIDTSSDDRAVVSAAQWVKDNHSDLFVQGDDRAKQYEMMTIVIGILRAKGYDAHRVVNHPSRPVGDPGRYGSDALVLNGVIYDCYSGIGDLNDSGPQALNVGNYEQGRLRE